MNALHPTAFSGHVPDPGEGRWTLEAAVEKAVPAGFALRRAPSAFSSAPGARVGGTYAVGDAFGPWDHVNGDRPIDPEPKPK